MNIPYEADLLMDVGKLTADAWIQQAKCAHVTRFHFVAGKIARYVMY